jgi:hypothetical protein
VYKWDVCVLPKEGLNFFKIPVPLHIKIFKINEFAILHWGITFQMTSIRSQIVKELQLILYSTVKIEAASPRF